MVCGGEGVKAHQQDSVGTSDQGPQSQEAEEPLERTRGVTEFKGIECFNTERMKSVVI